MAKAKRGDRVKLHYTGRLTDGREFDSTEHGGDGEWTNFRGRGVAFAPMELVIGSGKMFAPFEEALVGMEPGQQATITIPADRAYGPRREDWVTTIPRDEIVPGENHTQNFRVAEGRRHPNLFKPKVGGFVEVQAPDGSFATARVRALTEDSITLDANHPLAGQDLVYEIKLVEIV